MTGAELATRARKYTGTTSTTYGDTQLLADVNVVKDELAAEIVRRNDQMFVIPSTDALVASSVTAREYALPDTVLGHILTVEAAFDSTQATVFVPILPYPGGLQAVLRNLDGITEAKITNLFNNQEPKYYLTRRGIYILSGTISTVSGGSTIRYRKYPADLANLNGSTGLHLDPTTSTFGMPLAVHEIWARRVSIIWKSSRPNPIKLSPLEEDYDKDLEKALRLLSRDDYGEEEVGLLPIEESAAVLGYNS